MTAPSLLRAVGTGAFALTIINTIVGSGIFGLPAAAAGIMGPAALIGYVGCAILVGLVALCFAECGSRVPETGGTYAWARAAFGPAAGSSVGYLMAFANLIGSNAAVGALLVASLRQALPPTAGRLALAIVAVIYLLVALTNIRGVGLGARVSGTVAAIKVLPLVALVLFGIWAIEPANLAWAEAPSVTALGQGMVLLFFAFMGAEGPLSAIGEVRTPTRTIPRALAIAVLATGTLYLGVHTVAQGVLGPRLATLTDTPLAEAGAVVFGPAGRTFMLWAAILSTSGYITADLLSGPRMLYALAADGMLPRPLAQVHPVFRTPHLAIAGYVALAALLAMTGTFRQLAVFAASGTLLVYLVTVLGLLRLRARGVQAGDVPFRAPGGAALPLVAAVILVGLLLSLSWSELGAAGGLAVVGLVPGALLARRFGTGGATG